MNDSKNFKILLAIFLFIVLVILGVVLIRDFKKGSSLSPLGEEAIDISSVIKKKNDGKTVSQEEEKVFNEAVQRTADKKIEEIETQKTQEGRSRYTQEELDFIANPSQSVETEMGVEQTENQPLIFTPEQLDVIANPDKYTAEQRSQILGGLE